MSDFRARYHAVESRLGLPVRGMRWQVHHLVGTVVDPVVPSTEQGATTVTPAEIIHHRRVRLLSLADELGNVAAACRQMGISRTRYYEWRRIVAEYGLEALMPKARSGPAAAQRHSDPRRRGPVDPGGGGADDRLPPVRRPARRTRLQRVEDDRAEAARSAMVSAVGRSAWPERRRSRRPRPGCPRRQPTTASRSGSATTAQLPGTWWRRTASTSATSKGSARCTS